MHTRAVAIMRLPLLGFLASIAVLVPPDSFAAAIAPSPASGLYMSGDDHVAVLLATCSCSNEGFDGDVLQYVEAAAEDLMLPLNINVQDTSRTNVVKM